MRYFFIINPRSKGGKCQRIFGQLFKMLDDRGVSYNYKIITSINEARSLPKQKLGENYDVIVAVGGDGTINAVLNGMYNNSGCLIGKAAFGVIYTGTSPDFCKSYGIPLKLSEAIHCLLQHKTVAIPVPQIKYSKVNNPSYKHVEAIQTADLVTGYYACCANVGIGPALARKANSGIRNILGDKLGTLCALFSILSKKPHGALQLECDNQKEEISRLLNLSIGRTRYVASGIRYQCGLHPNEKMLYKFCARNINLLKLPVLLYVAYSGCKFKNKSYLYYKYHSQIEINYNKNFPEIEMDGDAVGYLPCKIQLAKDELPVITKSMYR